MEILQTAPVLVVTNDRARAAGVVIASTFGNALSVTPTVSAVFGVFLVPIVEEFHWSRALVSGAAALVALATAVASPAAGWMGDVVGARRTALIGSLALGLAILSLGLARPVPIVFYLQFALIGGVGALTSSMIYSKLLSEWFEARRGLWMGISSGASGLGSAALPLLASATLMALGWRGSFVCISLIVLLIGLPLQFFLLVDAPVHRSVGLDPLAKPRELEGLTAREAFRTVRFWLLLTSLPIGGGILVALAVTMVPILLSNGVPLTMAATAFAVVGLTSSIGEATVGFLLDHSKSARRLCPLYLMAVLGLLILRVSHGALPILAAGVLIGIGMAGEFSALSYLISRYFGRKALGTISGVGFGLMTVVISITTVMLNSIYDRTGSYRLAIFAIIPFLIWNVVAPLLMGRYHYDSRNDL